MSLQALIFFTLITYATSQQTTPTNQTDLQAAMADMQSKSYYGFVILVKLLNVSSIPLKNGDVTFLVPDDQVLSDVGVGVDHLHEFVLRHIVPSALAFSNLLRFPTGTILPTSVPGRMLSFVNNGKAGVVMNNAKVVRPNLCNTTSLIKCHGISQALAF